MLRVLVFSLCVLSPPLVAQQAPLLGRWKVSLPVGGRVEAGAVIPITGTAVLTIVPEGDSLIGTLVVDPIPDLSPRPPARLAASASSNEAVFVSRSTSVMRVNGEERPISSVSTWKVRVQGDSLLGTVERSLQGGPISALGPQPVAGARLP